MKKITLLQFTAILFTLPFLITSCQKKPDPVVITNQPPVDSFGAVRLKITHAAGTQPLALNSSWYLNEHGDSFQVTIYKYYISNVKLVYADGTEWVEPDSYRLINEAEESSKTIEMENVPNGNYVGLKFMIGVDSARNVNGAQTGALDPINGMYWPWNGYIMAKVEGISPQSTSGAIVYHCGGFAGRNNGIRDCSFSLPESIDVKSDRHPEIHLRNDILEWFKTPYTIDFSILPFAMDVVKTQKIADNYEDMFVIDHVHNE